MPGMQYNYNKWMNLSYLALPAQAQPLQSKEPCPKNFDPQISIQVMRDNVVATKGPRPLRHQPQKPGHEQVRTLLKALLKALIHGNT